MAIAAETIIENARVLTLDEGTPRAEAVALGGGRILAVGGRADMSALRGPGTRVMDAGGGTLMPGFVEGHLHLFTGSVQLDRLSLKGLHGFDAVAAAIRARAAERPGERMLMIEQADLDTFGDMPCDRHILDRILADRPLALMESSHHTVWANTAALAAAGLLHGAPMPPGNEVVMGPDGLATGVLLEFDAFGPILALTPSGGRDTVGLVTGRAPVPAPTAADRSSDLATLRQGLAYLARHGITSAHVMDGDPYQLSLYASLEAEGALTTRLRVPFRVLPGMDPADWAMAEAARTAHTSDRLRADFVKVFMDGVLGTGTAAMLAPYDDRPGVTGDPFFSAEEWTHVAVEADRRGFQLAVHAIGDLAVRMTLDGFEAARAANGARDSRHRVEHIETCDPADLPRFAALGVVGSPQPTHAPGPFYGLAPLIDCIGPARARSAYPAASLLRSGARMLFSSDWPVVALDPLIGIRAALERTPLTEGAPQEAVTLHEALAAHTAWAAWTGFDESVKGRIAPGLLADLVLLSGDIEATPTDGIDALRVVTTFSGGNVIYQA